MASAAQSRGEAARNIAQKDMIGVSPRQPDSIHWSLADTTGCGRTGYMRPCQLANIADAPGIAFPLAACCEPGAEMVFVVDDEDDVRNELAELVARLGFAVTECRSGQELQEVVRGYDSGLILLDLKMPGMDGIAVQEWLGSAAVHLPIIFVSGADDVGTALHCVRSGAFDFVQKPVRELVLRTQLNAAIAYSRKEHCFRQSRTMVLRLVETLTPTELVVALMIAQGYVTKLIAGKMQRSVNTVKIHRQRVFAKLLVNSSASIANLLRHCGLLPGESD